MYEQITANKRKSFLLFGGFLLVYAALAAALYWYAGPEAGITVAAIAFVMVGIALWGGDDMAVMVAGGRQITSKEEAPELWRQVENLSIVAGVPMPRLYISPDRSPNAFAAGRTPEQAIICVNQGLLDTLDAQELQGVVAHEMSHIRNYDVRLMTYATVLAGSIALLAQIALRIGVFGGGNRGRGNGGGGGGAGGIIALVAFLVTVILAPIAAAIIQMSISRKREYVADASAAELTRYPQALASALQQITSSGVPSERNEEAIAHMKIAPAMNAKGGARGLMSTHPPTEDRIARLMDMASGVPHNRGLPVSQTFVERGIQAPEQPHVAQPEQPTTRQPDEPSTRQPQQPDRPQFYKPGQGPPMGPGGTGSVGPPGS